MKKSEDFLKEPAFSCVLISEESYCSKLKMKSVKNEIMRESIEFVLERAAKTISAAKQVAVFWTWPEQTIEDMEAAVTAIRGNGSLPPSVVGAAAVVAQAGQAMFAARGAWDDMLNSLHQRTVQGLNLARTRNGNNPANLAVLAGLTARGTNRAEILAEALAWELAWAKMDPAWSPLPTNSLGVFQSLRQECAGNLQQAFLDTQADYLQAVKELSGMADALEQTIQAWYADAIRVFIAGTPQGDMIRRTVPTTNTPPAAELAPVTAPLSAARVFSMTP